MFVEIEARQLNKSGEELCGDNIEIVKNPDNTVIVLSDGLGSGVKANILSTLTKKIASTMLSNGMDIEDVVETIGNTLPTCQSRKIAYSTFTIVQISDKNEVNLVEFDNPETFFIHDGCITEPHTITRNIDGKNILLSKFKMNSGDFLVLISYGMIHAGLGGLIKLGWGWNKIGNFLQRNALDDVDCSVIADKLIYIANELYQGNIGDDTTVVVIKVREKRVLTIAVGPPVDKNKDEEMVNIFMHSHGRKAVCGGTTANIVSRILNKEIHVILNDKNKNVPPKAEIEGIDLVTEGVITLSRTVEVLDKVRQFHLKRETGTLQNLYSLYSSRESAQAILESAPKKVEFMAENPAEELAYEMQKADKIKFIVGRAINPAHQNPNFPVESWIKLKLINELKEKLEKYDKEVEIVYF